MNLDRVTITGADDSVQPEDLAELSADFDFVEWGILVHAKGHGPRFPSPFWFSSLQVLADTDKMDLSLHVCGRWVRDLLIGKFTMPGTLLQCFDRIQLNFHAANAAYNPGELLKALRGIPIGDRQFIFQIDGASGSEYMESLYAQMFRSDGLTIVDAVPLFDISGGAGVLPAEWPAPICMGMGSEYVYHGYAGGLGPENLAEQIPLIGKAAGETRIWIDMETRVRSADDRQFDLEKVRRCLEIAKPFVKTEEPCADS